MRVSRSGSRSGETLSERPGAALVEEDEPPDRGEPPVEAGQLRVLPAGLEGADPAVDEDEVERSVADDLVGDPDVVAAGERHIVADAGAAPA